MTEATRPYDQQLLARGATLAPRITEPLPVCWFCPDPHGPQTKEHIFPRWLLRHMRAEAEEVHPVHRDFKGREISSRGPIRLSAFVNGQICEACNGGWMAELEAEFMSVYRDPRTTTLRRDQQRLVARWFTKTAVALHTCQNYRILFPAGMRHQVRRRVPQDVSVYLGRSDEDRSTDRINFMQGLNPVMISSNPQADAARASRCHHIAMRIGDLVGVVVWAPPGRWLVPTAPLRQLWPPDEAVELADLPGTSPLYEQGFLVDRRSRGGVNRTHG